MVYSWRRPSNIPFPSVWLTFKEKDLNSKNLVEYRVQDLPIDRFNDAIEHMTVNFLADAPMAKSTELLKDPISLKEVQDEWKSMLEQHVTLVCFKKGSDEIIGMNVIGVITKEEGDEVHECSGRAMQVEAAAIAILTKNFKFFEKYKVSEYMSELGLSVATAYRGRGIGEYILRARIPLGKSIGIEITNTIFTSTAAQILAKKVGFELDFEIT